MHMFVRLWRFRVNSSPLSSDMGKLNIANHHPFRRDYTEKVRKDEEEARRKEESEDGRIMLAVSWHDNPCCPTWFKGSV